MIVVLKPGVCEEKKSQLTDWLAGQGLSVHPALGGAVSTRPCWRVWRSWTA